MLTTTAIMLLVVLVFFYRRLFYSRIIFVYAGLLILLLLGLARVIRWHVLARLRQSGQGVDRVLIIGAGEVGRTVMRNLIAQPDLGYRVIGFLDDDPIKSENDIGPIKALGSLDNLPQTIQENAIDQVIITLPWQYHRKTVRLVADADTPACAPVWCRISSNEPGRRGRRGDQRHPADQHQRVRADRFQPGGKTGAGLDPRWFGHDPPVAVLACDRGADQARFPRPDFFRQERVGKDGKRFTVFKFRSMYEDAEERLEKLRAHNEADGPLFKMKDDPRRTRMGRFIRKTSLDELPQLINVLRGEMSIVGPRPGLPSEVAQYQEWHRKRLEAQPGITGLWQVSGRSNLTFDEMVMLDIYYAENWSVGMDLRIMLRTVPQVLFGEGAY